MSIKLFEHNQKAYESAIKMLAETGKAAIIHPTGTGKSFIGFKYCEDNPDKTVCWVAPSEYIFKTQLENLEKTGAEIPENINFFTYARLMNMSNEEINEIKADCILYDEYHRAGGRCWQNGVAMLNNAYPNAPKLGLSATNIRYLDNQRNMADELFEGNIASEMTLGEAIALGILNAPKYVTAVYDYQKSLNDYKVKIKRKKNSVVREKSEEILEQLRRALENAEGLDKIFEKHIAEKSGKYILFVPNSEAMYSVKSKCSEWFAKVDPSLHIYTAYSDDPETSKAFADFKADNSDNLKLLIAIDMLNEGIHVDGINGVILFRPTISPIIYKQQIGRALSADKKTNPLILDIVANIYNLCSIDSLKNEIVEAVQKYTEKGEKEKVIVDSFEVYDEVNDCRELFEELEKALSSGWDEMYKLLCDYVEKYHTANVPNLYKTPDGIALGAWVGYMRGIYRGKSDGILDEYRINKLNKLGFIWDVAEAAWETGFQHACHYADSHFDMNVPCVYTDEDGYPLGQWIRCNRNAFRKRKLSEDRINRLQSIGMVWDADEFEWSENYRLCKEYYLTHNGELPDKKYISPCGRKPDDWLKRQIIHHINNDERYNPLTDEQINLLKEIGVNFELERNIKWNACFEIALNYFKLHGHLNVPASYVSPEGLKLLKWLDYQRRVYAGLASGVIDDERKAKLDSLNFDWSLREVKDTWPEYFNDFANYVNTHNGKLPTTTYISENGLKVGSWFANQKMKYKNGKLSEDKINKLKSVGVSFENDGERRWIIGYRHAEEYFSAKKNLIVPALYRSPDGYPLGEWVRTQVKMERAGKLMAERKALMEKIGVVWKRDVGKRRDGSEEARL